MGLGAANNSTHVQVDPTHPQCLNLQVDPGAKCELYGSKKGMLDLNKPWLQQKPVKYLFFFKFDKSSMGRFTVSLSQTSS